MPPLTPSHSIHPPPTEATLMAPWPADALALVQGYASVFHRTDRHRDYICAGAFQRTLHTHDPSTIAMLWQHNRHYPIGYWTTLQENNYGLYAEGYLTDAAFYAHQQQRRCPTRHLSIGYTVRHESQALQGGRLVNLLHDLDLSEISLVHEGANHHATFTLTTPARAGANGPLMIKSIIL